MVILNERHHMNEKPLQPPDRPTAPIGSSRRLSALAVVALIVAAAPVIVLCLLPAPSLLLPGEE